VGDKTLPIVADGRGSAARIAGIISRLDAGLFARLTGTRGRDIDSARQDMLLWLDHRMPRHGDYRTAIAHYISELEAGTWPLPMAQDMGDAKAPCLEGEGPVVRQLRSHFGGLR